MLLCQPPQLAHGLSAHLQGQLALALAPSGRSSADERAAGLVQQLVALKPPAENVNAWVHQKGEKIARSLQRDPELAPECLLPSFNFSIEVVDEGCKCIG